MVFRAQPLALWTVLAAALCLCSWSAPPWTGAEAILDSATAESLVALEQDYAVVAPAPTLIVRAVLNGGDVSPHKNCTDADFNVVQKAVDEAMIMPTKMDRRQLSRPSSERQLTHNCAHVCAGLHKYTCINTYAGWCSSWAQVNCDPYCRRHLQPEGEGTTTTMVILDDAFYAKNKNGPPTTSSDNDSNNRRNLLTTAWDYFTEDKCNEAKAELYKSALSVLGDVANECANLMLAQASLQCLAFLDDAEEKEEEGY